MATTPTGTNWADVALALILLAKEDTAIFVLAVTAPMVLTAAGVIWFAKFIGADRVQSLIGSYVERIGAEPTALVKTEKRHEGGQK